MSFAYFMMTSYNIKTGQHEMHEKHESVALIEPLHQEIEW